MKIQLPQHRRIETYKGFEDLSHENVNYLRCMHQLQSITAKDHIRVVIAH